MVFWVFWYFDILSVIIYGLSLYHARGRGNNYFEEILLLPVFGFFLEYSTIQVFSIYHYNTGWPVMLLGVPVSVALSWANIVYAARLMSDTTSLGRVQNSMMQALIAVSLDLAMDPNSTRIGPMWTWDIPQHSQYFGIPWANYFGWIIAVFAFSYSFRYFSTSSKLSRYYVPLTLLASVVGVGVINAMYTWVLPVTSSSDTANLLVIGLVITGFLVAIFRDSPTLSGEPTYLPALVFGSFLLSYAILGNVYGVFNELPWFTIIYIIISVIQMVLLYKMMR